MGAIAEDDGARWRWARGRGLISSRDGGDSWPGAQAASESSGMKRKGSATSAAGGSARSRGRAHLHHREELLREGDAGVAADEALDSESATEPVRLRPAPTVATVVGGSGLDAFGDCNPGRATPKSPCRMRGNLSTEAGRGYLRLTTEPRPMER